MAYKVSKIPSLSATFFPPLRPLTFFSSALIFRRIFPPFTDYIICTVIASSLLSSLTDPTIYNVCPWYFTCSMENFSSSFCCDPWMKNLVIGEIVERQWHKIANVGSATLFPHSKLGVRNQTQETMLQWDILKNYVVSPGAVPQQDWIVRHHIFIRTLDREWDSSKCNPEVADELVESTSIVHIFW